MKKYDRIVDRCFDCPDRVPPDGVIESPLNDIFGKEEHMEMLGWEESPPYVEGDTEIWGLCKIHNAKYRVEEERKNGED
jgi:hypothetical protein